MNAVTASFGPHYLDRGFARLGSENRDAVRQAVNTMPSSVIADVIYSNDLFSLETFAVDMPFF